MLKSNVISGTERQAELEVLDEEHEILLHLNMCLKKKMCSHALFHGINLYTPFKIVRRSVSKR
jgi:hypothetical protein